MSQKHETLEWRRRVLFFGSFFFVVWLLTAFQSDYIVFFYRQMTRECGWVNSVCRPFHFLPPVFLFQVIPSNFRHSLLKTVDSLGKESNVCTEALNITFIFYCKRQKNEGRKIIIILRSICLLKKDTNGFKLIKSLGHEFQRNLCKKETNGTPSGTVKARDPWRTTKWSKDLLKTCEVSIYFGTSSASMALVRVLSLNPERDHKSPDSLTWNGKWNDTRQCIQWIEVLKGVFSRIWRGVRVRYPDGLTTQ